MSGSSPSPETSLTRREIREQSHHIIPAVLASVGAPEDSVPAHRQEPKPRLGRRILSWGTIIATPLLFVGVSLPVNLFYPSAEISPAIASTLKSPNPLAQAQSFIVASSESTQIGVQRESWSVTSYAEVLRSRYGGRNFSYSTTGMGSIRWPFPTAVPISSGFGDRVAPCGYCSSDHRGLDFTAGNGSAIFAVADGVVTASELGGGYGQYVFIEHEIAGQTVVSVYAHMQRGSSPVQTGDLVRAGDFLGLVGNTGTSTGPHLHLEIRIEGEFVDPFAWLKANAL